MEEFNIIDWDRKKLDGFIDSIVARYDNLRLYHVDISNRFHHQDIIDFYLNNSACAGHIENEIDTTNKGFDGAEIL